MVGWHPVHVMREAKAGRFPQPVATGPNSIAFVEEEVLAWMEERIRQRDAVVGTLNNDRECSDDQIQPWKGRGRNSRDAPNQTPGDDDGENEGDGAEVSS